MVCGFAVVGVAPVRVDVEQLRLVVDGDFEAVLKNFVSECPLSALTTKGPAPHLCQHHRTMKLDSAFRRVDVLIGKVKVSIDDALICFEAALTDFAPPHLAECIGARALCCELRPSRF